MFKSIKHAAEKARLAPGEKYAAPLMAWLNSEEDASAFNGKINHEAKQQVAGILDGLAEIGSAGDGELTRCRKIAGEINAQLSKLALVPQVEIHELQPLPLPRTPQVVCSFDFQPAPGSLHLAEMKKRQRAGQKGGRKMAWPLAHQAFMLLFDLWRSGYIDRLRRCARCENFLYRGKRNQEWCSSACREAAHQSTPEYKEKRNARLRGNYKAGKDRDERNRQRNRKPGRK
jgi:hypothetical protein